MELDQPPDQVSPGFVRFPAKLTPRPEFSYSCAAIGAGSRDASDVDLADIIDPIPKHREALEPITDAHSDVPRRIAAEMSHDPSEKTPKASPGLTSLIPLQGGAKLRHGILIPIDQGIDEVQIDNQQWMSHQQTHTGNAILQARG
jgi:hypothetical protein